MLDREALRAAMRGADFVFHLAANADVRFGTDHPRTGSRAEHDRHVQRARGDARERHPADRVLLDRLDLRRAGRCSRRRRTRPFPVQTSLYGASKLAGEGLIQAYCEGFGFQGYIFRFVSILGERYTHGHVFDFYQSLRAEPDATARARQRPAAQVVPLRAGLHRRDASSRSSAPQDKVNIFNLGTDEYCEVNDSIGWITGAPRASTPSSSLHRRRARLDRRQPVHLPRHGARPLARLDARG